MPHKRMGCLPFFAATRVQLLLPFNILEANYLLPPPNFILSTTDLIAQWVVALQKWLMDLVQLCTRVHDACNWSMIQFEKKNAAKIRDFNFKCGNLILIHNMAIEKSLYWKMQARYFSLMVVVSKNWGGTYIVCELDRTLIHRLIAAYQAVPYFTCNYIEILDLKKHINVSITQLCALEESNTLDPDDPEQAVGDGHEPGNNNKPKPEDLEELDEADK